MVLWAYGPWLVVYDVMFMVMLSYVVLLCSYVIIAPLSPWPLAHGSENLRTSPQRRAAWRGGADGSLRILFWEHVNGLRLGAVWMPCRTMASATIDKTSVELMTTQTHVGPNPGPNVQHREVRDFDAAAPRSDDSECRPL